LEGEIRQFGFAPTAGNHTINSPVQQGAIYDCINIALAEVIKIRRREIGKRKNGANKVRIKFILVPIVYVERQTFLIA